MFLSLTDTFSVSAAPREEQSAKLRDKLMVLGANKKRATAKPAAPELRVSPAKSATLMVQLYFLTLFFRNPKFAF